MRVVLWDEKAELYYPYLKKGSELAVIGQFESRMHKDRWVHEVVSENLLLLRNIDWENGERIRLQANLPEISTERNDVFVVGQVQEEIRLDWLPRPVEHGGESARLSLRLQCGDQIRSLRVVVLGSLAELAHPYLQSGSRIAVDGYLRSRDPDTGRIYVELTARNVTFLENINWAAGEAARLAVPGGENLTTVTLPDQAQAMAHGD
jgi:single-stranded DNA-binding protein